MTVAPWGDNSGNKHHQIGFSESGLFWRTGFPESLSWDSWIKIVTADINGAIQSSNAGLKIGPSNTSIQSDGFSLYLNAGGNTYLNTNNNAYITNSGGASFSGNVGIGTTNPTEKLTVNGNVYSKEVKVDVNAGTGPDYVFESTYQLPSLTEIESYIKANKHLPEVPSAKEMETNGINLSEMNMLLLKKVEELTLHLIEQSQTINSLKERISNLESQK
ncbi:MAG: hypothetical protein EBR30_27120 [Cytophagia bacterium]|nr:hypothetical protein [Cytophagia bacterium]